MGYPRRPDVPGATYHVVSKGTNGETIFYDDADREAFLWHLDRVAKRYGWVILAYCLMTTHYHLVLKVPLGGLSAGMQQLNRRYSWRTNRRHGRTMHLFRQRFFSAEIKKESQLLEALRYTALNPPRAGMCEAPDGWRWSSYRACAGIDVALSFLAVQDVLDLFGRDPRKAEMAYRAFVQAGLGQVSETGSNAAHDAAARW